MPPLSLRFEGPADSVRLVSKYDGFVAGLAYLSIAVGLDSPQATADGFRSVKRRWRKILVDLDGPGPTGGEAE